LRFGLNALQFKAGPLKLRTRFRKALKLPLQVAALRLQRLKPGARRSRRAFPGTCPAVASADGDLGAGGPVNRHISVKHSSPHPASIPHTAALIRPWPQADLDVKLGLKAANMARKHMEFSPHVAPNVKRPGALVHNFLKLRMFTKMSTSCRFTCSAISHKWCVFIEL
jgi:hypothetical protein